MPPSPPAATGTQPQVGSGSRLIVAIDFGTTNTGLAWMEISSSSTTTAAPAGHAVRVFEDWPRSQTVKVPSVISYTPTTTGTKQWGHDIADGSEVLRWTKLELRSQSREVELERLLDTVRSLPFSTSLLREGGGGDSLGVNVPVHLGLAPLDIIADFLKKVARCWHDARLKDTQRLLQNVTLDLVVTHPGVWPYESVNQTVQAVCRAFSKSVFPTVRSISLCTEPEACALYTALTASAVDGCRLHNGDCFIVCDAGGGTVRVCQESGPCWHQVSTDDLTNIGHGPMLVTTWPVKIVLDYLGKQIGQVRAKSATLDLTHIFMSGGFADSPHLFSRVKEWARMRNIQVEKGDDCWGAVVRGAVLKGAGTGSTPLVPVKFCPRSFGISVTPEHRDYDRNFPVETRILWLVRRGDYIPDQGLIETSHDVYCCWSGGSISSGRQTRVEFVATAVNEPLPRSTLELSATDERIVLAAKFNDIPREAREKVARSSQRFLGPHHSEAIVRVELRVEGSGTQITLRSNGKVLDKRATNL
ncbi:hypothetical protein QBC37DRAFT_406681 [Rhypophila decipiens]|uniref:Actin-like ATPase domain-containing protein n=1 Tax=Rhypophila decipiens TaxID=261697 RepID=A0AAN7B3J2_9PEZI|nr:hypothetical protein QBC37DRAFT_406681 [Rhypophila decipiens]